MNPGTALHHVRTLVEAGFLAAEEGRPGRRGTVEIPYRATGLSWETDFTGQGSLMIRTFLDEIGQHDLDEVRMVRMGFKLSPERLEEMRSRIVDIALEYHRTPDDAGEAHGFFLALHPEEPAAREAEEPAAREAEELPDHARRGLRVQDPGSA